MYYLITVHSTWQWHTILTFITEQIKALRSKTNFFIHRVLLLKTKPNKMCFDIHKQNGIKYAYSF